MRHSPNVMGIIGTAPAVGVSLMTKLKTLPMEVKIDMFLRWGMYCLAMAASITTVYSFIKNLKKRKK